MRCAGSGSAVRGQQPPALSLDRDQVGHVVIAEDLEAGEASTSSSLPPALVDQPRTSPCRDESWGTVGNAEEDGIPVEIPTTADLNRATLTVGQHGRFGFGEYDRWGRSEYGTGPWGCCGSVEHGNGLGGFDEGTEPLLHLTTIREVDRGRRDPVMAFSGKAATSPSG